MNVLLRDPPEGFTEDWNPELWNVGFVFRWSDVFESWLDCRILLTVKPHQTLADAFEKRVREPMFPEYNVFFVKE